MVAGRGRCQAKLGSMFLTFHEHVDRARALQVLPELLLCGFAHNDDLLSRLLRKLFQRDPDTREVLYSE